MTAYIAVTDEERRRNMDRDKATMLKALRAAIAAGADASGHNVRGRAVQRPGTGGSAGLAGGSRVHRCLLPARASQSRIAHTRTGTPVARGPVLPPERIATPPEPADRPRRYEHVEQAYRG